MFQKKPFLLSLLIALYSGGVILTTFLLLGGIYFFQKKEIEDSLLESNLAYAMKIADTTDRYLAMAQRELAWTASELHSTDASVARYEVERLRLRSAVFNSVGVVDAKAAIIATSPYLPALTGVRVHSAASQNALAVQKPLISGPFTSIAGNDMIMLSHPLRSPDGHYLGYLGGSIYLKKQSMLSDLIGLHFYKDNVSVTIVDRDGKVIFNTVPTMTRSPVNLTPQLKTYMSNNLNGSFVGRDYLVGYAGLKKSNWNIIVSTPSEVVTSMLFNTVKKISGLVLAILFFITTGVAFLSSRIAKPLEQLARLVQTNDSLTSPEKLSSIRAWYQEAYLLREAMEKRFRLVSAQFAALSDEAMTDPLTGLYNRRGFYEQLTYIKNLKNQCAIAVDIDHFKAINDRFGHSTGDDVLVHTADLLRLTCRKEDVISRFGGEEFVILLTETTLAGSAAIAERIRQVISATEFSEAGHLTVSIGVAGLKDYEGDYERLLMEADSALYQAKRQGRNRVVVSGHSQ